MTQASDIAVLKELIDRKDEELARKDEELARKDERIAYLERMLFGSRRDRLKASAGQQGPGLFDDEFEQVLSQRKAEAEKAVKEVSRQDARRRQEARKPSRPESYLCSPDLEERERTLLPEGIRPEDYDVIGQDVTRILRRDPAKFWIEKVVRPVLRLKADRQQPSPRIVQAPAPGAVIGGNHVGADVLAQIACDKFISHMPEYRQAKRLAQMGVRLSTSTINGWVHATASKLYPLYETLCEDIRARGYLQVDEVPWRIADAKGSCRKGYAWQFRDATPDSHGQYFYYLKGSRAGSIARAQLRGFRGAVQTDGYGVYDYFEHADGVTLLACMAHVRRKFVEAQGSSPALAAQAVSHIDTLYALERSLRQRHAPPDEVRRERQDKALPIMDWMEAWMQKASTQCTPADLLGKAIDYAYKLWPRLRRYTEDGIFQIDNNPVERGQRPTVMGRKNFLFSKNDRGAEDNAVFYSLLGSCETVGVNPLDWLTLVLTKLHSDMPEDQIRQLLPYYYKKSRE